MAATLYPEEIPSQVNVIENLLNGYKYDVIHSNQIFPTETVISKYGLPVIQTIHSEILGEEVPCNNPLVLKYICVRQSIYDDIKQTSPFIPEDKLIMIPNGINFNKFKNCKNVCDDAVGFFGTISPCRKHFLIDTMARCKQEGKRLYIIDPFLCGSGKPTNDNVVYLPQTRNMAEYYDLVNEVVDLNFGRLTFEALYCGKKVKEYIIDRNYNITGTFYVDKNSINLSDYDIEVVVDNLINVYQNILSK